MLRKAKAPLATTEIAERIMVERGLDARDKAARTAMITSVGHSLRHQRESGGVQTARRVGKSMLWELAD